MIEYVVLLTIYRFEGRPSLYSVFYLALFMYQEHPFVLLFLVYNGLHHFWEFLLASEQLRCVLLEMTINEWITRHQCGYITQLAPYHFVSAFDRGVRRNVERFFFEKGPPISFTSPRRA